MRRIVIAVVVILAVATALTLIPGPRQHSALAPQAHATSYQCAGVCPPPPSVSLCAAGGVNPNNGNFYNYSLKAFSAGQRVITFFPAHAGCQLVMSNIFGTVVSSSTVAAEESAGYGIWQTTDSTCALASLNSVFFAANATTNVYHPSDVLNPPAGIDLVGNVNTSYCIGYNVSYPDWYQTITVYYGFE